MLSQLLRGTYEFKLTYRSLSLMNYICLPDLLLSFNPVIAKSGNKKNLSQMVPYKPFHSSLLSDLAFEWQRGCS